MSALDIGRVLILGGGWAYVLYVAASIIAQHRPDPDEDDDASDRGHDAWVDEQTGVHL